MPDVPSPSAASSLADDWLFGWDSTPGIVSVWADRTGRALVWQRAGDRVTCTPARFRPWLWAATLDDLAHLGPTLVAADTPAASDAPVCYQPLADAPLDAYPFLLFARDGRTLERAIVTGAAERLGRPVSRLAELGRTYYQVGPVEQYLMATGRVYFRGLTYADLHRLQFDLETTALDPQQGRIFLVAVRDSRGLATVLEAPTPADEARLIADLCALIRARDPDVIENHNLVLRPESRIVEVVRGLGKVHATLVSVQTSSHLLRAAPVTERYDS